MHSSPLLLASPALTSRDTTTNDLSATSKRYAFPPPYSKGSVTYPYAKSISGSFDGGIKTYGHSVKCTGQTESGDSDAVFLLEDGATLSNAIVGENQHEGVHCLGSCTLKHVWWEAVGKDALIFKGAGTVTVTCGGAQGAEDKVIQNNGASSVTIDGLEVYDFGKLCPSCGNCNSNGSARKVTINNVKATPGKMNAGIYENYGDVATIESSTCATSVKQNCAEYVGNNNGAEPDELKSGPSTLKSW